MNKKIVLIFVVIGLAVAAFFVFKNKNQELPKDENTDQQEVTLENYSNDNLGIALTYPSNLEVDEADDGRVTFSMIGPSQTEFTELFDALGVSFFRGNYEVETFEDFVNKTVEDWEVNGTVSDPLKKVKVADLNAYTFEGTGLGKYRFYLLPVGDQEAIQIVVFVEDPTEQGFQEIVDDLLDSLTVTVK